MRTEIIEDSKEHFQTFRTELLAEAHERNPAVYYLTHELLSFLEATPSGAFNGWFWRLHYLFAQWRKDVDWPVTQLQLDPY